MPSSHPSSPIPRWHPRGFGRALGIGVALVCLLAPSGVAGLTASAAAQTGPGPGPVDGSATTSTVATPVVSVDPTATTTIPASSASVVPATTTTSLAPAPWTVNVPGPPPPPPPPGTASPADIARAAQLERQIVTQSDVLDVLAAQFDLAQQKVTATAAQLDEVRTRLATASATADGARSGVASAGQTLRRVAVDAYVNLGAGGTGGRDAALSTFEGAAAQTDAETAMGKALDELRQLHQAQLRLQAAETALVNEAKQAAATNTAAQAAAVQAQAAAQAATVQQQQLLTTVSQVSGNLVQLVAAAHDAEAQAAFNRFRASGGLDFAPPPGLAGPSAQAATVVQAATAQVGKPYVWGAAGPTSFDCSGLVQWAWGQVGVALPRVASDQQAWAIAVPISQLAPGDLVFFGNPAHHVGMYVGGGLMVDAPHTGATVSVVPIWWDDLAGFGRVHRP